VTLEAVADARLPTPFAEFRLRVYLAEDGKEHLAMTLGDLAGEPPPLVRVHSECLTGEAFGSLKCECGPQLDAALERIRDDGGVVVYLRGHEGRGIGLINKLRAYRLQEDGLDTLDANLTLGLPADSRDYGAATAILKDLGISSVRLLSNNPEKARQLRERGVTVTELVPLVVGVGEFNEAYLEAKRDRMGHSLPDDAALNAVRLADELRADELKEKTA
jgi:3,4-dihydroxy 2-butanone 4-phosphate synthase/GTP cyclohydrolase II